VEDQPAAGDHHGLENQHTVAVGEKTIFLADGFIVGAEGQISAGKSGNQHEERRLGQVEVCQEFIDNLKLKAGKYKERSAVRSGPDSADIFRYPHLAAGL
jgi:hypothetical protein